MCRSFVAALGLLAGLSGAAWAEDEPTRESERITLTSYDYISAFGGYALPDRGHGATRHGLSYGALYGNQFSEHFAVEGRFGGSVFNTGKNAGTDFYQYNGSLDLVYGLNDRRTATITPFALVGVGVVRDNAFPNTRDRTSFGADAALGFVTRPLYWNLKLRGEARYLFDNYEGGDHDLNFLLGFEIPLGRVKQHLTVKQAPARTEIREVEKVVARTVVDSDGDNVPDDLDQCPDTPKGLHVDATGCVIAGQTLELKGVTFDFNKARLQPNAQSVLDIVARGMIGQRTLKSEIAGHTDSIGSDAYNQKLSQQRADAVREYLIESGVKPEQLTAVGYGESQLKINPEKDEFDRELNRRVEFRVTEK